MVNGLQGIPGSGKSYEAVAYHVMQALKQGRKVITNLPLIVEQFAAMNPDWLDLIELRFRPQPVRGTWDAARVDDQGQGDAIELFPDGHTEDPPKGTKPFGHVWDFYSDWKHPVTRRGPLFIVDECHIALPKMGTDPQVIEYFKLHRHFNADVLLMTQVFRDMCQDIAGLIAILVKCRKADILGKKDEYIRNVHAGYRGAVISSETRKYQPQFFTLYRSHTQGLSVSEAEATDVKPLLVNFNRFKWVWLVMCVPVTVWAFWPGESKPKPLRQGTVNPPWLKEAVEEHAKWKAAGYPQPADELKSSAGSLAPPGINEKTDEQPVGIDEMPEPFANKGIHLTGQLTMMGRTVYTFALSNNAVFVNTVTSPELEAMGYAWKPLTDCAGALHWKSKVRAITCDSPKATIVGAAAPA